MAHPGTRFVLACALGLALSGCRLNIAKIQADSPLSRAGYDAIELERFERQDVLRELGPPDRVRYMREYEVLAWTAAEHHGTDLNFFVPAFLVPVAGPGIGITLTRRAFSPFEESEEFREPLLFRFVRIVVGTLLGFAPFGQSQDVVTLHGRDIDHDTLLVVLDRSTRRVTAKRLELSRGLVVQEGIVKRAFLITD